MSLRTPLDDSDAPTARGSSHEPVQLRRALGRWSVLGLMINSIIGSAIFGLPSIIAGKVGNAAPLVMLVSGLAMAVIVACYAEVSSQFRGTGGNYLYARVLGRHVGIQIGWINLLVRLAAVGAALNLFVSYLGEFWPAATQPGPRIAVISGFLALLALVNYCGVASGARLSNATAIAKLVPVALLCVAGLVYSFLHPAAGAATAATEVAMSADGWLQSVLLLFFAYGGAESALNPMGEARNPQRDAVFAMFVALAMVIVLYTSLQFAVMHLVADPAHSERPLAEAARTLLGSWGAQAMAAAALVSVYGFLSANMLTGPRITYALAEHGDFPALFARLHPRFRTPHVSIVVFAMLAWGFALFGSFAWNVTLSAVGRLFFYAMVCIVVPVLRARASGADAVRIPGGNALPALGLLICAALLTRVDFSKSLLLAAVLIAGTINWAVVRRFAAPQNPGASSEAVPGREPRHTAPRA